MEDLAHKGRYVLIKGDHGSGKSYIALRLLQEIDPVVRSWLQLYDQAKENGDEEKMNRYYDALREAVDNRLIYSPTKFIEQFDPKKTKPHSVFIFDEAGAALNTWEWHEFYQKGIDKILQVGRRYRVLIVFIVPRSSRLIQSHVRLQFHYMIRTLWIDFENEENIFKMYHLEYWEEKKGEWKYILKKLKLGYMVAISLFTFKKAHDVLIELYEDLSKLKKAEIIKNASVGKEEGESELEKLAEAALQKLSILKQQHGEEKLMQMKFLDKNGMPKRAFLESIFPDVPHNKMNRLVAIVKTKLLEKR